MISLRLFWYNYITRPLHNRRMRKLFLAKYTAEGKRVAAALIAKGQPKIRREDIEWGIQTARLIGLTKTE